MELFEEIASDAYINTSELMVEIRKIRPMWNHGSDLVDTIGAYLRKTIHNGKIIQAPLPPAPGEYLLPSSDIPYRDNLSRIVSSLYSSDTS